MISVAVAEPDRRLRFVTTMPNPPESVGWLLAVSRGVVEPEIPSDPPRPVPGVQDRVPVHPGQAVCPP